MALQKAGIQATVMRRTSARPTASAERLSIAPNGLNALGVLGAEEIVESSEYR